MKYSNHYNKFLDMNFGTSQNTSQSNSLCMFLCIHFHKFPYNLYSKSQNNRYHMYPYILYSSPCCILNHNFLYMMNYKCLCNHLYKKIYNLLYKRNYNRLCR